MQRRYGLRLSVAVCVALLALLFGCSASPDSSSGPGDAHATPALTASVPPLTPSSSAAPKGLDPEKFTAAVNASVSELNDNNTGAGDFEIANISIVRIIGFVDITLSDTAAWSALTDAEKKEYMTALGKALDALAIENTYPGTTLMVGTDTTLFSPDGKELAERTSLGIVKLYG